METLSKFIGMLKGFYGAFGAPYPIISLIIISILGALLFGGSWWFLGKQYNHDQQKSIQCENEFGNRDQDAISYIVVKRGSQPEVESLLLPHQKGWVTDTRNTGYPDPLVRETFIEFRLTEKLLNAENIELSFKIENESAIAGSIGHYQGTGTSNFMQFGASTPIKRFELNQVFFKIDITSIVKQYAKDGAGFIGFRFSDSEGTRVSAKQFYVCGEHVAVR